MKDCCGIKWIDPVETFTDLPNGEDGLCCHVEDFKTITIFRDGRWYVMYSGNDDRFSIEFYFQMYMRNLFVDKEEFLNLKKVVFPEEFI